MEYLRIGERIGPDSYHWNGTEVAVKKCLNQDFSGDAVSSIKAPMCKHQSDDSTLPFSGCGIIVIDNANMGMFSMFLKWDQIYYLFIASHTPIKMWNFSWTYGLLKT